MAYPGGTTYPGATTFPGITIPPGVGEGPVPTLRAAPQSLPPSETLLVMFTPPTGRGAPVARPCPTDLQFGSIAPGGYNALSATIDWPDGYPPPDGLLVGSTAQVIDGRSGEVVWHGIVTDPGFTKTATGASHKVTAQGMYTILDTTVGALAYVDRDLAAWQDAKDWSGASTQVIDDKRLPSNIHDWLPPANALIEVDVAKGTSIDASTPSHTTLQYLTPKYSSGNQDIVAISSTFDCSDTADFEVRWQVVTAAGTVDTIKTAPFDPGATDSILTEGTGTWSIVNARVAQIQLRYTGSTDATASRDHWLRLGNLSVVFRRNDQAGNALTDPTPYVRCYDLVNDIIGRALRDDLFISEDIAQPGSLVEQAAWWEGITARGIFDFVTTLEPDYYWAVWGPMSPARPQPRFEYVPWRRAPRYLVPPGAAILALAGGGDDMYDTCLVHYQAANNVPASVFARGTQQDLAAAGLHRTLQLDLSGEGVLTEETAIAKGIHALATADYEKTTGTATLTGPVMDLRQGRLVEPWEVRAGWMVVFADGSLRADGGHPYSLTGSRDGRSTFRCTEVVYSASSASAELTLDGGGRNLFNRVRHPLPRLGRPSRRRGR